MEVVNILFNIIILRMVTYKDNANIVIYILINLKKINYNI